ncbi:MAG: extracellular solute-binding protein, partial [Armatimonadetes bacterium]|nr:extracellular solute-binding protein [Armatimonadota bacterium]
YGLVFTPNVDILGHLIYSKGGEFINSNQAIFNDSIGLESLNYLRKLVDDKIALYSFSAFDDFVNQKAAMYIETTSKLAALRKKAKFNFKISVLPQGKERNYQFAGTNLAIFSTTQEEQDMSWEFIKWLTNKENSMKWAHETGYLPIYQSIIEELKFKEYFKNEKEYFEAISALKYAKVQPKAAVWENIRGFIDDAVYNCVSGKLSPQEALDKAVAMANKILR